MKKSILLVLLVISIAAFLFSCGRAGVSETDLQNAFDLLANNEYEQAQQAFEKIIAEDPSCTNAYIGVSVAYLHQGNAEECLDFLKKGYEFAGNYSLNNQIIYVSDAVYAQLMSDARKCIDENNYAEAIELMNKAVSMPLNTSDAYVLRGNSYLFSGDENIGKSMQDYQSALDTDNSNAEAALGIAEVHILNGEYAEAEESLAAFGNTFNNPVVKEKLNKIEQGKYYDYTGKVRNENYYDNEDETSRKLLWRYEYERDKDGEIIRVLHYNAENQLEEFIDVLYDENGNRIQSFWREISTGELIKAVNTFDENNRSKITYLYKDINANGTDYDEYVVYEYDAVGNNTKMTGFNAKNSAIYVKISVYDEKGNIVRRISYDKDNSISFYNIYEYDDADRLVKTNTYSANGNLISSSQYDREDSLGTLVLELKKVKKSSNTESKVNNLCDLGVSVTNGMGLYVHTVVLNGADDNANVWDDSKSAKNVTVTLEYPSCVQPKSQRNELQFDVIELGTTSETVEMLDYECQNNNYESYGDYTVEKNDTLYLTTKKCPNEHIIKAIASAEGFQDAEDTLFLKVDEDRFDYYFDNLDVRGTLNIGDNCSVYVDDFSLKDDWFFQKNSNLIMGVNSSLTISGNCLITPNTYLYLQAGTLDIYGNCELKNCEFAQNTNIIMHSYGSRQRKLKMRKATVSEMIIDGGFLDVELDVNSKDSKIEKIYYTKTNLYNELREIDSEALDIVNWYVETNEKLGTDEQNSLNLFSLSPVDGYTDQDSVERIEIAINKWFLEYYEPNKKIKDWNDVVNALTPPSNDEIDGVKITAAGGLKLDAGAFGYAEYNGAKYVFAPNQDGVKALVGSFNDRINSFSYSYVKSEIKKGIQKDTEMIGGKILSKSMEVFTNFCFAAADGNWEAFFKNTLKVGPKEVKNLAKRCKKLEKYYELIELFVDGRSATKAAYRDYDGFVVDSFNSIISAQKAIYGLM